MKCYLASNSPRRWELLSGLGLNVIKVPVEVEEKQAPGESPSAFVVRMAELKAGGITHPLDDGFGLGADTVVLANSQIMGKPSGPNEAREMLETLMGGWHRVLTGLALRTSRQILSSYAVSDVFMNALSPEELDWYLSTGEPMDKAGAYGIQGMAALFIPEIHGSYSNVMGLPVHLLYELMKKAGLKPTEDPGGYA